MDNHTSLLPAYIKEIIQRKMDEPRILEQLHYAAKNGYKDVLELLLQNGANIDMKDEYGWTVLHLLVDGMHLECLKMVLERGGVNVNATNNVGRTSLHLACNEIKWYEVGWYDEYIRLLLDHGADINAKDNFGKTPVDLADEERKAFIRKYLIGATNQRLIV